MIIKIFLSLLVLIFSLQSWSKADDIRDFEIEGISIDDSLLNYMTANEIRNNTLPYFEDERNYYIVLKNTNLKLSIVLNFTLKAGIMIM